MKSLVLSVVLVFGLVCSAHAAESHAAHEHGAAKMNIAIEEATVTIELDSPLDNILGFEHAPETEQQRAAVQKMAQRMNKADTLFLLTPAAQCTLESVVLESEKIDPSLLQGKAEEQKPTSAQKAPAEKEGEHDEHGDLEAVFTFTCAAPQKLNSIDVRLFQEYSGVKEIEVQLVTPKGQKAVELTPKNTKVSW